MSTRPKKRVLRCCVRVTYACCSACCTARAASCTQRCSRCYFGRCVLPHPGSYVHGSSVVLPQLHDAHGMLLGPRPTPLAECLRCQLLSFDDETLEGWLGGQARRGPPCGTSRTFLVRRLRDDHRAPGAARRRRWHRYGCRRRWRWCWRWWRQQRWGGDHGLGSDRAAAARARVPRAHPHRPRWRHRGRAAGRSAVESKPRARGCCSRRRTHSLLVAQADEYSCAAVASSDISRLARASSASSSASLSSGPRPLRRAQDPTALYRTHEAICVRLRPFYRHVARWDQAASSRRHRCRPSLPCMPGDAGVGVLNNKELPGTGRARPWT